ncbi:MAG: hypothetical protein U0V75_00410 [Ferruginibacter sp.]
MIREQLKYYYHRFYQKLHAETVKGNILTAQLLAAGNSQKAHITSLDEVAFRVFSQRGEDGIIQYICSKIPLPDKTFIEFGVENYTESNTRLLLFENWRGLVMDSSRLNIRFIKKDFIYWKYDLTAMHSFITAENINGIIAGYTSNNDPGLLSIDIDGNDYWVWEAISCIQPRVVICEYNAVFGSDHAVSIPYNPAFIKNKAHYSCLYFGASLPALCLLAEKKGYDFIGTSAAGVNAFFIRKDLSAPFVHYTAKTGFHASANRDSKDEKGNNSFLPFAQRLEMIKHLPVTEVSSGSNYLIKDLYKI